MFRACTFLSIAGRVLPLDGSVRRVQGVLSSRTSPRHLFVTGRQTNARHGSENVVTVLRSVEFGGKSRANRRRRGADVQGVHVAVARPDEERGAVRREHARRIHDIAGRVLPLGGSRCLLTGIARVLGRTPHPRVEIGGLL